MNQLLEQLNEDQRQVVENGDGPVLVLAGAGSGKTRVITARIAYLIQEVGVSPYRILAMTFTNKAAREMKERIESVLTINSAEITVTTFHSFCARFLRREIDRIGRETNFVIYDSSDQLAAIKRVLKALNLPPTKNPPNRFRAMISNIKNSADWHQAPSGNKDKQVFEGYRNELERNNALDFDDLLLKTIEVLEEDEQLLNNTQTRFQYVMVDEFQDTNVPQLHLLRLLTGGHGNVFAVGDEDQSIYGWRGAEIKNILDFPKHFGGMKQFKLEQNYRSTKSILDFANEAIAKNEFRNPKKLWTQAGLGHPVIIRNFRTGKDEAEFVARNILNTRMEDKASLKDMAILFRSNYLSRNLEETLRKFRIPFQLIGGLKFYDRKEIKDILAYMRITVNPRDWGNFERAIGVPSRGIGSKSLDLIAQAFQHSLDLEHAMEQCVEKNLLKGKGAQSLKKFLHLYREFRVLAETEKPSIWLSRLIKAIDYKSLLLKEDEFTAENRANNLEELLVAIEEMEAHGLETLAEFLDQTALVSDQDEVDQSIDKVTLMTVHAAKGLEFDFVYVVGLEEGIFPNSRAVNERELGLEEERRLFYVATTRARKRLTLTHAAKRQAFGSITYQIRSRFLKDQQGLKNLAPPKEKKPLNDHIADLQSQIEAKNLNIDLQGQKTSFKVGQTVVHPKFGKGRVVKVQGMGSGKKVMVLFLSQGTRIFHANRAPLKAID